MSVTIQLPATIEQHFRDDASREGISLEGYLTQLLTRNGRRKPAEKDLQNWSEEKLLDHISLNVSLADLEEYHRLKILFQEEKLTASQHERLLALSDLMEIAHAERMKYVIVLAQKRGIPLEKMMNQLDLPTS